MWKRTENMAFQPRNLQYLIFLDMIIARQVANKFVHIDIIFNLNINVIQILLFSQKHDNIQ